jgi:hypothetical protein
MFEAPTVKLFRNRTPPVTLTAASRDRLDPFELDALLAEQHASGEPWLEYFRVPSLRAGLYVLAPGA